MKRIPLSQGFFALVDDDDYERVANAGKWQVRKKKRTNYAMRTPHKYMHRFILGEIPEGMCVDHIDGDGLNNQRSNLRAVTKAQNANYRIRKTAGCSSQYRGVFRNTQKYDEKRWTARIKVGPKRHTLGYFPTEVDAAKAYDAAGKRLLGEFFKPNFPEGAPMTVAYARPSVTPGLDIEYVARGKLPEDTPVTPGLGIWSFR